MIFFKILVLVLVLGLWLTAKVLLYLDNKKRSDLDNNISVVNSKKIFLDTSSAIVNEYSQSIVKSNPNYGMLPSLASRFDDHKKEKEITNVYSQIIFFYEDIKARQLSFQTYVGKDKYTTLMYLHKVGTVELEYNFKDPSNFKLNLDFLKKSINDVKPYDED